MASLRRIDPRQFEIDKLLRQPTPEWDSQGKGVAFGQTQSRTVASGDRTDEFAPFTGERPSGTFAGDAPDLQARVAAPPAPSPPRMVATDAPPVMPDEGRARAEMEAPATMAQLGAPPTMIRHNNKGRPVAAIGGDTIDRNRQLIEAQEGYQAPRSTKDQIMAFVTGGIPGGLAYATDQNTRNQAAVGGDIEREQGQIDRELGLQGKQASIEAAKYRPVYQQGMLDARQDVVAQGQDRIKQGDRRLDQGDTRLDQGATKLDRDAPVEIDIDGEKFKVPPRIAARLKTTTSEGGKNRTARAANTDKLIAAIASRQDKQIAATIAELGDPQEMYAAASDLWEQAQQAEQQANAIEVKTEADVAQKKQLMEQAAKLRETTVKIQQEARKIPKGGRVATKQLDPALEKRIRAAAAAKGLDPDTAVERARNRQ